MIGIGTSVSNLLAVRSIMEVLPWLPGRREVVSLMCCIGGARPAQMAGPEKCFLFRVLTLIILVLSLGWIWAFVLLNGLVLGL